MTDEMVCFFPSSSYTSAATQDKFARTGAMPLLPGAELPYRQGGAAAPATGGLIPRPPHIFLATPTLHRPPSGLHGCL